MGCITSKHGGSVVAVSPVVDCPASAATEYGTVLVFSGSSSKRQSGRVENARDNDRLEGSNHPFGKVSSELRRSKKGSSRNSFSVKLGLPHRLVEAEQVAAGWPAWLSSAAGEAVHGWVPLHADAYEKLEKIGQGTYSSVFRAREVETGRMVALKKVRFDNFQPDSIRFMAREIMILRRLDHPNVMKLEGVITSPISSSIYLVFEYMEHDLAGLSSCPYIKFTEAQVKCYMKQLLCGIEHCHLRGVMHRDIKASNILVSDQGILKMADFGLANVITPKNRHQLTSRVVTLWYRPPELLMGSTSYEVSIDIWSVGCVFAELLMGRPLLKGRTEVEQLHKIFKLCGSPPDDYWKKIKLPHSTMFKPQHHYESCLRERCRDVTETAVDLLETFLSIEPHKRGTASSALLSEYFHTQPYACDPSTLPKYPPNKEMDAKQRDELRRKKIGAKLRESGASRKQKKTRRTLQERSNLCNTAQKEEMPGDAQFARKGNHRAKEGAVHGGYPHLSLDTMSETSQATATSQGEGFTGPPEFTASSSFAWVKKRKDSASTLSYNPPSSRSQISAVDSASFPFSNNPFNLTKEGNQDASEGDPEASNPLLIRMIQNQLDQQESSYASEQQEENKLDPLEFKVRKVHHSRERSFDFRQKPAATKQNLDKVEFSGPLISQPHKIDELLQRNENHIRRAARRSRFDTET
ncbi:hypothetical protein SLE2022_191520 [Rubroshorea leprosula]